MLDRLPQRLASKIDVTHGCWLWMAARDPVSGYGRVGMAGSSVAYAHRAVYELLVGPIPEGLQLDHLCRVRHCVNPDHLEPVTCRENLMRGDTITARNARKTHCPHGHEYDEANTGHKPDGSRVCRACGRDRYWRNRDSILARKRRSYHEENGR